MVTWVRSCDPVPTDNLLVIRGQTRYSASIASVVALASSGAQGPQGEIGPQGPAGNDGAAGPKGDKGDPGDDGAQGPAGNDGAQGPAGNDGAPGQDGAQGIQGVPGNDGAQGPQGDPGIQGEPGIQGPQGEPGSGVTLAQVIAALYPVGCLKFSADNVNPGTYLSGTTWAAWGAGRVLVGFDAGQTEFDVAEETGGAKTHTLTAGEMPAHTHVITSQTATTGGATSYEHGTLDTSSAEAEATETTGSTGGGGPH